MIEVRLILPLGEKGDRKITLPCVPKVGSEFNIRFTLYKVYSVRYVVFEQLDRIDEILVYLKRI